MCVHHWNNEETKSRVKEMLGEHPHTDRQFLGFYDGEKAKALQHWGGEGDFFYCHWYADDEDAIFDSLEAAGFNSLMVSLPHEMQRYVKSDDIKDETLVNPDKA